MNVAVTVVSALSVTVQVPMPEQLPPDQPANVDPESGVAVRVTWVPSSNWAEHVDPQSIFGGELVTVPVPAPDLVAVRRRVGGVVVFRNTSAVLDPPAAATMSGRPSSLKSATLRSAGLEEPPAFWTAPRAPAPSPARTAPPLP